jgi:hypothetical protein
MKKHLLLFVSTLLFLSVFTPALAVNSTCVKFPTAEVQGQGPLPYNYRVIDGHVHAGGHPFNHQGKLSNTDEQALSILSYLKSRRVETVIDLENTKSILPRYKALLLKEGITFIHIPLTESKVPTKKEWETIFRAMQKPVYVHCYWGADRTGIIIAKYLIQVDGYSNEQALNAVVGGGTHAGYLGGLKKWYLLNPFFRSFLEN